MHDLAHFTLEDMSRLGGALRRGAEGSSRMAECASRVVGHLHDSLRDESTGARSCVSVRFFMTQRAEELPADPEPANPSSQGEPPPPAKWLVLLAKSEPDALSDDGILMPEKRAVPLTEDARETAPLLCALIDQFELDLGSLVAREPVYEGEASHRACNVFQTADVPSAIAAHGVRSLLGFGGLLPSGNLFFVMLYLQTIVSPAQAAMFRPIAINVKIPLLALDGRGAVFELPGASDRGEDRAG